MKKSGINKNRERKRSRKRVETTGGIGEKRRKKQRDSDTREEMFCLWRVWAYCPSL